MHYDEASLYDSLLPVLGLVKHMIPVAANALATEKRWEATALGNHLFWKHHFVLGFWFPDDKFANL